MYHDLAPCWKIRAKKQRGKVLAARLWDDTPESRGNQQEILWVHPPRLLFASFLWLLRIRVLPLTLCQLFSLPKNDRSLIRPHGKGLLWRQPAGEGGGRGGFGRAESHSEPEALRRDCVAGQHHLDLRFDAQRSGARRLARGSGVRWVCTISIWQKVFFRICIATGAVTLARFNPCPCEQVANQRNVFPVPNRVLLGMSGAGPCTATHH